ncbi:MAG: carbohydrate-binding protein, partial [Cellvibrio sp.]|nr:carbohydrate-binding protein [Cellvibrio sp.]
GTASFGFLVNNPGPIPTAFTLNGAACGGTAASSTPALSSSSAPTSATTSSRSSSSVANTAARWLLDSTNSTFHFVTVKKTATGVETPESLTFSQLQGTVAATGQATLTIPLASISTGNATRDPRMQGMLFETNYLPSLHFTTQLDLAVIDAMAAGSTAVQSLTGNLVLHGIVKPISFDALVVKHSSGSVSFSPRKPIVINSTDYDLNAGVEALRLAAGLSTIGEKVPVYFKMFLNRDNPDNVPAIALAPAPDAAINLSGTLSNVTGAANLNWVDVSSNETGFLVRRKLAGTTGQWVTMPGPIAANTVSYIDSLTVGGSYEYKVISYTDSIPATATSALTLVYAIGSSASSTSSSVATTSSSAPSSTSSSVALNGQTIFTQQCASCHALTNSFPTQRNLATLASYIDANMPIQNPALCDANCSNAVAAYLLGRFTGSSSSSSSVASLSSSSVSSVCVGDSCAPAYADRLLRVLTKSEYINSVNDLTGVNIETTFDSATLGSIPADLVVSGFTNNARAVINENSARAYTALASKIATATNATTIANCTGTLAACGETFVTGFAKRAFRRPLTTEERTNFIGLFNATYAANNSEAIKFAVRAVLESPQFLYRSEVGVKVADLRAGIVDASANLTWNDVPSADRNVLPDTAYVLTPYELASFLAFTYTGSTPDATLLTAADNKALATKTQIDAQIERLLTNTKARQHFGKFAVQWLGVDGLPYENRSATLYPNYTPAVKTAMLDEVRAIYNDVILDGAPFTNLYASTYTFANATLAQYYGLGTSGLGSNMQKVTAPGRGGLMTTGAFLAQNAHAEKTAPILRSVRIRRALLCHDVPPPPTGVSLDKLRDDQQKAFDNLKAAQGGFATTRQEYHFLTGVTPCTNCHEKIINPLGFGFENFDPVGLPRTRDSNNLPIAMEADDGTLYGVSSMQDGASLRFTDGKNFGEQLISSAAGLNQVRSCFIQNNFRMAFATGLNYYDRNQIGTDGSPIPLSDAQKQNNANELAVLIQQMTANGNSTKVMLQTLGNLKSVRYRKDYN